MQKILQLKDEIDSMLRYLTLFIKNQKKNEIFQHIDEINIQYKKLINEKGNLEKRFNELTIKYSQVLKEKESLESELEEILKKYSLISVLLSVDNTNEALNNFKKTLYGEFLKFANKEYTLANEAEMFLKLQKIEKELELISAYPKLHSKTIIAVGGGFSAGKSEFISSFMQSDRKLPRGLNPTTAIPTYVIHGEEQLIGINNKGGIVKFDKEKQYILSHDFIKSIPFNLREIMPYIIFSVKLDERLENVCLIDTPGYNPSGSDYTFDDVNITKSLLKECNALIWLIGLDSNGTIPNSDLEFLEDMNLENKKLFIVLNKADLKTSTQIEEIIENIADILDDNFIDYEGISAYSSTLQKEINYYKKSIFEFLQTQNKKSSKYDNVLKTLNIVYEAYKNSLLEEKEKNRTISKILNSISLDILEEGILEGKAIDKLQKLKNKFSNKQIDELLKELDIVINKLKNDINKIFQRNSNAKH